MLNLKIIKAVSIDLDDTLWPIWPTIERAEQALAAWLGLYAPITATLFADVLVRDEIRTHVVRTRPELSHNLSAVRRELIRTALHRAKENPLLAEPAFDIFFAERNRVTMFDDAVPTLAFLAARFPLVALSNGNADIRSMGIHHYFQASLSAQEFGVGKPDVRIFHAAAFALGTNPNHVLHIGDDPGMDVLGALNAGMQTAWLNRHESVWNFPETPHITVTSLRQLCDYFGAESIDD